MAVTELNMGLVLPSEDDFFDEQNYDNANSTRIAGHTHGAGSGVPVARGDTLHVTNGLWVDTGDLIVTQGRIYDGGSGHSLFYDGTAGHWTFSDQVNVAGSLIATGLSVSVGASSQLAVTAGAVNFGAVGELLTGDLSNATPANRLGFQSNVVNGSTTLDAMPNGTGRAAAFAVWTAATRTNTSFGQLLADAAAGYVALSSTHSGSGTDLPLVFIVGAAERARVTAAGYVGIGTNNPQAQLHVASWVAVGGAAAAGMVVGDVSASRSATTGQVYLGSNGLHSLGFDGTNYNLPAGGLVVGNGGSFGAAVAATSLQSTSGVVNLAGGASITNGAGAPATNYLRAVGMHLMSDGNLYLGAGTAVSWIWNGAQLQASHGILNMGNAYYFGATNLYHNWDGNYFNSFLNQLVSSLNNTRYDVWIGGGTPTRNSASTNTMHVHGTLQGWPDNSEGINQGAASGNFTLGAAWGSDLSFGGGITAGTHYAQMPAGKYAFSSYTGTGDSHSQGMATAWLTYACVDHARELGLFHAPIADALGTVLGLQPYYYDHVHTRMVGDPTNPDEAGSMQHNRHELMRDEGGKLLSHRTYGFAASDVAARLPELVARDADGTPFGVDLDRLVPVLWEAVRQLADRVEALTPHPSTGVQDRES